MDTADWVVLVINEKTNEVDLFRDLVSDDVMHFFTQYQAETEVTSWDTSGKVYRFINLKD